MKKFVSLFISLMLTSITLCAQAPLFKGVAVEGSINDFMVKLKAKGCEFVEETKSSDTGTGIIRMKGSYAGYRNCQIILFADEKDKDIETVRILMPLQIYKYGETIDGFSDNYKDVRSMYLDVKSKLTEKYGNPVVVHEKEIKTYHGGELRKIAEMEVYSCGWTDDGLNQISLMIAVEEIDYEYYANVRVDITNITSAEKSREKVFDDM